MGALILVLHTPLPPSLPRPPPGAISANPPAQGSARCAPLGDALLPHPDRTVKREVGGRPRTGEKLKKNTWIESQSVPDEYHGRSWLEMWPSSLLGLRLLHMSTIVAACYSHLTLDARAAWSGSTQG